MGDGSMLLQDVVLSDAEVAKRCQYIASQNATFAALQSIGIPIVPDHFSGIRTKKQLERLIAVALDNFVFAQADVHVEGASKLTTDKPILFVAEHHSHWLDTAALNRTLLSYNIEPAYSAMGTNLLPSPVSVAFFQALGTFPLPRENAFGLRTAYQRIGALLEGGHNVWISQSNGLAKKGDNATNPRILDFILTCSPYKTWPELLHNWQIIGVSNNYSEFPGEYIRALRDVCGKKQEQDDALMMKAALKLRGTIIQRVSEPVPALETTEQVTAALDRHIQGNRYIAPQDITAYNIMQLRKGEPAVQNKDLSEKHRAAITAYIGRVSDYERSAANAAIIMRDKPVRAFLQWNAAGKGLLQQHELLVQECLKYQ